MYNKSQTFLLLYLDLKYEKQLRSQILHKYNITERTLRRYIADLKEIGFLIRSEKVKTLNGVPIAHPELYIIMEEV